jgi:hypothetical protein
MQDANTIASAPRSTIICALVTTFFPQQPPQETKPMNIYRPGFRKRHRPFPGNLEIGGTRTHILGQLTTDDPPFQN